MSSFLENYVKSPNYPKAYPGDYLEVKNNLNAHFYVIYRNLNMCSSLCSFTFFRLGNCSQPMDKTSI